jgi:tol-pal system protein YbgF
MIRRAALVALAGLLALGNPVWAQDRAQTLADIRQELTVLFVDIQNLKRELSTSGSPTALNLPADILGRVNAIESELTRLTAQTEALQLRVDRIVADGTNRIGDLEFRLVELEGGDLSQLSENTTLGGGDQPGVAPVAPPPVQTGPQLAVGEQGDFDRARALLDEGRTTEAATALLAFTETYPGSALSDEAHYLRGEAESRQGNWTNAARAYLASFSGNPNGARAPDALFRLGVSLEELGQRDDACLTLGEVGVRFPAAPAAAQAATTRAELACP